MVEAIDGLRVVGRPVGPLFAVTSDDDVDEARRVDPHRLADAMRRYGFIVQLQPGLAQGDGTRMPPTAHLTVTPVTERILPELSDALRRAADDVRGAPAARADEPIHTLRALEPAGSKYWTRNLTCRRCTCPLVEVA